MKNKLFYKLFFTLLFLISQIHAYSTSSPTGCMTEEELMASVDAYVNSLPPSSRVKRDGQQQIIQVQETQQEPLAQHVGAFAGGSGEVNNGHKAEDHEADAEEIVDDEDYEEEEEDYDADDDNSDYEEEYEKKQSQDKIEKRSTQNSRIKKNTGEKRFECLICHKRLARKSGLQNHMRSKHTGEKPFECPICHKRFAINNNMPRHIRTKHPHGVKQ